MKNHLVEIIGLLLIALNFIIFFARRKVGSSDPMNKFFLITFLVIAVLYILKLLGIGK